MKNILLIDFGSTYTKLSAVDIESESIIGTASSFTTIESDINEGLENALSKLRETVGDISFEETFACSSAAGGLRMMASGLVPELTSEAAKMATLGAGAKIIKLFSFELTEDDIDEIKTAKPDIFLLVGGTDGGNTECITHNARMLSSLKPGFPIIIAGNRNAAKECQRILNKHETYICPNVMPKFGVIDIIETQSKIREIFLKRIVSAKGLSKAASILSDIMMPTPSAVLQAMNLLAEGTSEESGIGELIAVDVGGATTDIYSIASGKPSRSSTVYKGLPEPYSKRTVEGDIGMRYSVKGIVDAVGIERICEISGLSKARAEYLIEYLSTHTDVIPNGDKELENLDYALAAMTIETAVSRHAGTIEETYTMYGLTYLQSGKDLRDVNQIVVTGGSLIHTIRTADIASYALFDINNPMSLRPKNAEIRVDRKYILASMGLLASHYPETALRIMKKELIKDESNK